ncbi:MAG: hypothetical protein BWK80_00915 [Desulfobacteraceae bacterium IS3]|nr:MAG: hypothetical protein BWK80_00915 [Desulfobacteraceae bacterium IS3]
MKIIDIKKEKIGLTRIFNFARKESVLLLADGEEFILSRADDFEAEVEAVRNSAGFQSFLDSRMKCRTRFPIEDIEKEVEDELKAESETGHQHKAE